MKVAYYLFSKEYEVEGFPGARFALELEDALLI